MPHKANPVLATLVRRAALAGPHLAATLHVAAADAGDERPAGAWHIEWDTLRTLLRRTVVAAGQMTVLLDSLQVHADRMAATLDGAGDAVRSEQRAMAELAGRAASGDYLGASDAFIEATLARAAGVLA
jgi:3-carboxy-cis,cis-muconate cycloisomerase